jgi:hypothetical protein
LFGQFDDSFTPISFDFLDMPDVNGRTDSCDLTSLLVDGSLMPDITFPILDEAISQSQPQSPPKSQSSLTSGQQSSGGFSTDSSCCCLIRTLSLLKQLSPNAATGCTVSGDQGYENGVNRPRTLQAVIAENEQTIEAITTMLQCSCSQDPYLLSIMSLIVFKILGWYAAAVRETPKVGEKDDSTDQPSLLRNSEQVVKSPAVIGNYCIDGDDRERMAAQLVLSELHHAQRLVNELSRRLMGCGKRNLEQHEASTSQSRNGGVAEGGQNIALDGESTFPISSSLLNQLEADLRKRLRALTGEIVDRLRRG